MDIFSFKYISKEGCNKCLFSENKVNYLNPIINYDLTYINLFSIEQLIYFLLKNDIYICPKCGYGQNDKIINENVQNYYKIIENG